MFSHLFLFIASTWLARFNDKLYPKCVPSDVSIG